MRRFVLVLCALLAGGCAPRYYIQPPPPLDNLSGPYEPASDWANLTPTNPTDGESLLVFLPKQAPVESPIGRQSLRDYYLSNGDTALLLSDGELPDYTVVAERYVTVTAYNSRRDQTDGTPWKTASGRIVHDGIIAYNDRSLPFGTLVMFPDVFGNKLFVIEDRMNDRYGTEHADIWTLRFRDAVAWGQKPMRMLILGEPRGESP